VVSIKSKSDEFKKWKRRKNFLKLKRRTKRKLVLKSRRHKSTPIRQLALDTPGEPVMHKLEAPRSLSIFENGSQTLGFFADIVKILKNKKIGTKEEMLYIDMENVDNITIDAIMYLLAVMGNVKVRSPGKLRTDIAGSLPKILMWHECWKIRVSLNTSKLTQKAAQSPIKTIFKLQPGKKPTLIRQKMSVIMCAESFRWGIKKQNFYFLC